MIQTQFYAQVIRSNKGGEHFNEKLGECFAQNGFVHQSSCVGTLT